MTATTSKKIIRTAADLTASEAAALASAAASLNIPAAWLFALIKTESAWQPDAKNPHGSARGLIQWVDSTARALGYSSSADLVAKHSTRESQLLGPVVAYLRKWAPIRSAEELAAVNFYPAYRRKLDTPLPAAVQKVNPGIVTVRDYFRKYMAKNLPAVSLGLALVLGGAAFF